MEFKNWASHRIKELIEKGKNSNCNSTDYHKSKSDRLTAYIMGWGKYSYRNVPKQEKTIKKQNIDNVSQKVI